MSPVELGGLEFEVGPAQVVEECIQFRMIQLAGLAQEDIRVKRAHRTRHEPRQRSPGGGLVPALGQHRRDVRAMVLHGDTRIGSVPVPASSAQGDYFCTTWGFYLVPRDDGTTRLIARFRSEYNDKFANTMMYGPPLVEPISCVMQRKMLLGIKARAEAISRGQR